MSEQKISTIQKRYNLNSIYRDGEIGPGGAYHEYSVYAYDDDPKNGNPLITILFQKGPRRDPNAQQGVLDVDLLEIVRDRLKAFQEGSFATRENACALTHIEEALMWMRKRTEDRAERNVLGTMNR